ncbi:MAG: PrsW family intramembrane metalloprotease [Chloroflexota bacterium]
MQITSSNVILLSAAAAIIPALFYSALIYWFDRYEKEPIWLLSATFFWGAVPSIILALFASLAFSVPLQSVAGPAVTNTAMTVLVAPPLEETAKAMALVAIFVLLRHEVDSLLDGIIYGAMVGVGFAMVENFFYFVTVYQAEGAGAWGATVFLRAIVFGLNHSLFTSATGLGMAIARFSAERSVRILAPLGGWSIAVFLHAFHNLGASSGGLLCFILPFTDWGGVILLILIVAWALLQERNWIKDYLRDEIERGTLTPEQYHIACSTRRRLAHRLQILTAHGFRAYLLATRFYRLCSELAYKKHHYVLLQEPRSEELTRELRDSLHTLSRTLTFI